MNRFAIYYRSAFVAVLMTASALADPVDELLREEMRERRIPGVVLTVIKDGNEVKSAA